MARYKKVKERIQSKYNTLPKNQKKIADYILENFEQVPFLSVQEVSKVTDLSVASIVRFSQRVGFKGFLEMREEISDAVKNRIQNKEMFSLLDKEKVKSDTLTSVAKLETSNINKTLNLSDRSNFESAVKIILKSNRVFTAGLGVSHLLSRVFAYLLNQVGVDSNAFTRSTASFLEQLLFLNEKDAIILLSFPPYSDETIKAAEFARQRKIKVIGITNKDSAPVTFHSDTYLIVESENMLFTNSFAAVSVLMNAVVTECALKNQSRAKDMVEELNKISEFQI